MLTRGIVQYTAPDLLDSAAQVVRLNAAMKAVALRFEYVPQHISNLAVRSSKGLRLAHIRGLCYDSLDPTVAQVA